MSLSHVSAELNRHEAVREAVARLAGGRSTSLVDFPDAAGPALAGAVIGALDVPTLVVTARRDRAEYLAVAIAEYLGPEYEVGVWQSPDALPYEQLPIDLDAGVRRVQLLHEMRTGEVRHRVWITSVSGLMQLIVSPADLDEMTVRLRVGARYSVEALHEWATKVGYETSPVVQEPGTIARRGGIIDIFPPGGEYPIRLDFFGDDIESIRQFDPHTQRSIERLGKVTLLPPSELPIWRLPEIAKDVEKLDRSTLRPEVAADWERRLDQMRAGAIGDSIDLFAGYLVPGKTTLLDYLPGARPHHRRPPGVGLAGRPPDRIPGPCPGPDIPRDRRTPEGPAPSIPGGGEGPQQAGVENAPPARGQRRRPGRRHFGRVQ